MFCSLHKTVFHLHLSKKKKNLLNCEECLNPAKLGLRGKVELILPVLFLILKFQSHFYSALIILG